jgi:hypothetical protein
LDGKGFVPKLCLRLPHLTCSQGAFELQTG